MARAKEEPGRRPFALVKATVRTTSDRAKSGVNQAWIKRASRTRFPHSFARSLFASLKVATPAPPRAPPRRRPHALCLVAGTFDRLHEGHFRLLRSAFAHGRRVEVWLADDAMCADKAARGPGAASQARMRPFDERGRALAAWCDAQSRGGFEAARAVEEAAEEVEGDLDDGGGEEAEAGGEAAQGGDAAVVAFPLRGRFSLHALRDAFGPAASEPRYTAIACSAETRGGCARINALRAAAGLRPLTVFVSPVLLGRSGEKLSSTALREAEAAHGGGEE